MNVNKVSRKVNKKTYSSNDTQNGELEKELVHI